MSDETKKAVREAREAVIDAAVSLATLSRVNDLLAPYLTDEDAPELSHAAQVMAGECRAALRRLVMAVNEMEQAMADSLAEAVEKQTGGQG